MSFLISDFAQAGNTASVTFLTPLSLLDHAGISLGRLLAIMGDIGWELVSQVSGQPVYGAKKAGNPSFLGFLFANAQAHGLHLTDLRLADQVTLTGSVYTDRVGSRLTCLLRLSRKEDRGPVTFAELEKPKSETIYFQLGMIWMARTIPGSNLELAISIPEGHLKSRFEPCDRTAQTRVMRDHEEAGSASAVFGKSASAYRVLASEAVKYEISRDLDYNGVGLVYFANYPQIFDHVLSPLLDPRGLDRRKFDAMHLFYYGNADAREQMHLKASLLEGEGGEKLVTAHLYRAADRKLLGILNLKLA